MYLKLAQDKETGNVTIHRSWDADFKNEHILLFDSKELANEYLATVLGTL